MACAAVYALRVSDVSSFTWDGIATPRFITFRDQKVNAERVTVPLSPFLERWRDYIHQFRRPDQLPTTPLFPSDGLAAKCLRDLVEGTPSAHITWHPWKRFSAAAYIWLGGTNVGLQQWTRWRSPRQARHYARHPPTWTLADTLCLPLPSTRSGSAARDLHYGIIATKDLWPREAWARVAARAQRAAAPPAHVTSNPHFIADNSSSSGQEAGDLDSQHYPNPEVQPQARDPPENAEAPGRNTAPRTMPCGTPQLGAVNSQPDTAPHSSDSPLQPAEVAATDGCVVSDPHAVPAAPGPSQQRGINASKDKARAAHSADTEGTAGHPVTTTAPTQQPDVERRLFSTPQPRTPLNDPERPRTPRPTAALSASDPIRTPGSNAMPIDDKEARQNDADTQGDVHPHPEALQGCPDQPLHPPRTSDQRDPAPADEGTANDAATAPTPATADSPSTAQDKPTRPDKHAHIPTGKMPAPVRKLRQIPPPDTSSTLPAITDERRADAAPQAAHAAFWGYDLLAPRKGGGYLQWNPGPLPLPQVDRGSADGRFDHVTGGHIQGGAAHVHQGAEDQYRIAPPGGHGDAHHEPGVGHSDMDGDY